MADQLAFEVDPACALRIVERRGGEERTLRVGPLGEPEARHGGPLMLLRWMRAHRMLTWNYTHLLVRLAWLKQRGRRRRAGLAAAHARNATAAALGVGRSAALRSCALCVHESAPAHRRSMNSLTFTSLRT
jgi:hypothetical protein